MRLGEMQIIPKIGKLVSFPSELGFTSFSAIPLPNPLVLTLRVLSSLLPSPPLQILSQLDFFFKPLYVALHAASSLHLTSDTFPFSRGLFLPLSSHPSLGLLSPFFFFFLFSLGPINNNRGRRCLAVDSLTPITADTV